MIPGSPVGRKTKATLPLTYIGSRLNIIFLIVWGTNINLWYIDLFRHLKLYFCTRLCGRFLKWCFLKRSVFPDLFSLKVPFLYSVGESYCAVMVSRVCTDTDHLP